MHKIYMHFPYNITQIMTYRQNDDVEYPLIRTKFHIKNFIFDADQEYL